MDTTPEYIKMCEKAGEIQEEHHLMCGDVCNFPTSQYINASNWVGCDTGAFSDTALLYTGGIAKYRGIIWLPRQDQLQEMVFSDTFSVHDLDKFYDWADQRTEILHGCELESWEQLWLAFVMKEKYGKVWNGEEWA